MDNGFIEPRIHPNIGISTLNRSTSEGRDSEIGNHLSKEVIVRIAEEGEFENLLGLWTKVFDAPPEVFTCEYLSVQPELRPTFVAEIDGQIVSSVQLFGIPIRDEDKLPIMIGGLANVSTLPEFRGQGLGSQLVNAAKDEMLRRQYAWGMLLTGKNSFYERLGWRTIYRSFVEARISASTVPDESISVAYYPQPDLVHVREIHEHSFKTPLSRIRGDLDWEIRIPERIKSKAVFYGENSYAIVRKVDSSAVLEEWGMLERTIEGFRELLIAATRWAVGEGLHTLVISAPLRSAGRQACEGLFMTMPNVEDTEAMVLPLNHDWTMARILSMFLLPRARFLRMDNF